MAKKSKSKDTSSKPKAQSVADADAGGKAYDEEECKRRMQLVLEHFLHELTSVRTGRASPNLLDDITVSAYGEHAQLANLATVVMKGPHTLAITVYDPANTDAVMEAIRSSPLQLSSKKEAGAVLVSVPGMSAETRQAMVKLAHKYAEQSRVSVRHCRHHAMVWLKAQGFSEDEQMRREKAVDTLTKKHVAMIDEALAKKEREMQA